MSPSRGRSWGGAFRWSGGVLRCPGCRSCRSGQHSVVHSASSFRRCDFPPDQAFSARLTPEDVPSFRFWFRYLSEAGEKSLATKFDEITTNIRPTLQDGTSAFAWIIDSEFAQLAFRKAVSFRNCNTHRSSSTGQARVPPALRLVVSPSAWSALSFSLSVHFCSQFSTQFFSSSRSPQAFRPNWVHSWG